MPNPNNPSPVNLVSETYNFKNPTVEKPVEISSSPSTNEANQINVVTTQANSNNFNSEISQNNFPRSNLLSEAISDIKNFDFSNLSIGFSGITGGNIVGGLIAKAAKDMLGIREKGKNYVPDLDKMIKKLDLAGLGGNVAWCSKLTSVAAACAAKELDKLFSTDGKISKIFPEGTSVLNLAQNFKNNNSLITPKELSRHSPQDLIGTQIFLKGDGGKGHTGIVTGYNEKNGLLTVVEGNLGTDGKTAEVKYNLANLIKKGGLTDSEGEYKTKLIGFGDYNSLIKNADSELFASLQKDNTMIVKNNVSSKKLANPISI